MTLLETSNPDTPTNAPIDATTDAIARATAAGLEVRHLSATIGSVIHGVDGRRLDDTTVAAIRAVLLERKVVFLPDQHLDPTEHIEFARHFGEPTEGHPVIPGVEGTPEVFEIDYTAANELYASYGDVSTRSKGIHWHTDVTFVERPPARFDPQRGRHPALGRRHPVLEPGGRVRGAEPVVPGLPALAASGPRRPGAVQADPRSGRRGRVGGQALHGARADDAPRGARASGDRP